MHPANRDNQLVDNASLDAVRQHCYLFPYPINGFPMVALRALALVATLFLGSSGRALALIELPQETGSSSDPRGVDEQSGGNPLATMQEWAGTMGDTEVISGGSPDTQTSPATRTSDSEVSIPFAVRSTNERDIIYSVRNAAVEVRESGSLQGSFGGSAGNSDPFRDFTQTALQPLIVLTHTASCDRGTAQNQIICEAEREIEHEDRRSLHKKKERFRRSTNDQQ